jgi:Putative Ig domain
MKMTTCGSKVLTTVLAAALSATLPFNAFAQAEATNAQLSEAQTKAAIARAQAETAHAQAEAAAAELNATNIDTSSRQKFSTSVEKGWIWLQTQCTANPVTDQCAAAAVLMASNQCAASAKFLKKDTKKWQYLSFGLLLASAAFTGLGAAATIAGSTTVPKVFSTLGGASGIGVVVSSDNANAAGDQTALISINTTLNNLITYVATGAAKGAAVAPTIANGLSASGTVGVAFSYQIVATNSPTSFLVTGLPAGLSASASTGLISGTPTAKGTSTVTLAATNGSGTSSNATLTLNIGAAAPTTAPAINSAAAASGTVGSQFGYQTSATNSPASYSIAPGSSLPAGLSLNTATGFISGTPSALGTVPVTLTATNAAGTSAPFTLTFTIAAAPPASNGPAPDELVYKVASLYAAQCTATALSSSNK